MLDREKNMIKLNINILEICAGRKSVQATASANNTSYADTEIGCIENQKLNNN